MLPSLGGGVNWQGAAVDPETGILYVASTTNLALASLVKDPKRSSMDYVSGGGGAASQRKEGCGLDGPQGLPLVKGPWGRITAIDLNTGEHVWMVANSDTPDCVKNHPLLSGVTIPRMGKPDRSGIMVTKALVFAGEGGGLFAVPAFSGGPMFRAYDKKTGEIVSEFKLPSNQTGIPMTYMINDRQYIVVAAGARNSPSELIALTLP